MILLATNRKSYLMGGGYIHTPGLKSERSIRLKFKVTHIPNAYFQERSRDGVYVTTEHNGVHPQGLRSLKV